ncbi:homeobox-leucine zipper protein HAT5-like isoform X1 [Lycium barbarum]|uniref:homeobox-leucine zipper protein HAT5-like isoform X1 n=1 Tax=Lycium barbarum TaxID=112863 RepID=UPI00293E43C6|nr:homeobox-leucine zipper protein HAT5-like isoform X1 [Lycium barbarum]
MEVGRVNESCNMTTTNTVLLPKDKLSHCLWMSNSSTSFHGKRPASMVNFKDGELTKERPFFTQIDKEETSNDDYDSCFHQPEKKRRLLPNQVQFLEKSFEVDNKLEPERKVQLANELGLQPRQIAIWFQNRRARYKTKVLEKDYDVLKASFNKLKDDYDTLFKENENLRNEVNLLTEKWHRREKGKENSEQSGPISPGDAQEAQKSTPIVVVTSNVPSITKLVCKQEDASSAKSDVIDSDSPHHTDGNHSSNVLEPEPSDYSQDEDDNLSKSFLCLPEIGDQIQANSCNLSFQIEDQPCWFWQY